MKYSQEQLKFILEKKPELIKKAEPSLNEAIVEFLIKYEVYVSPPKNNSKAKDGAIAGAVASLAGPDLAGDALLIQGQNKQTKSQEWTQWKQWALDHKDFPKFQTDLLNKVHEYNEDIDKKFESLEYQKSELDPLIQANEKRMEFIKRLLLIILGLGIVGNIYLYLEDKNDNSSLMNNNIIKRL